MRDYRRLARAGTDAPCCCGPGERLPDDFLPDAPRLLNVVDLDGGRTGIILSFAGGDGSKLELFRVPRWRRF